MSKESCDITVLGGLPVRAEWTAYPSLIEWRPLEIPTKHESFERLTFCNVKTGKPMGDWLRRRIEEAGEVEETVDKVNDAAFAKYGDDEREPRRLMPERDPDSRHDDWRHDD